MANLPPIMQGIERRMQYLSQRQQVVAQNIANSETPGYKSRELAEPNFGDLLKGAGGGPSVAAPRVELTSGMKALGAVPPIGAGGVILDKDIAETKPDGNNVTIEDQLLRMGEIQADFTAMTSLYAKQLRLMKTAIGKGGN